MLYSEEDPTEETDDQEEIPGKPKMEITDISAEATLDAMDEEARGMDMNMFKSAFGQIIKRSHARLLLEPGKSPDSEFDMPVSHYFNILKKPRIKRSSRDIVQLYKFL